MLMPEQRTETLQQLATWLQQRGLQEPTGFLLDMFRPLDALAAQLMVFVRPFTTATRIDRYARALTDEAGWQELRGLICGQDS